MNPVNDQETVSIKNSLTPSADAFWDWAVRIYQASGVMESLLSAQDNYQADVNLLLLYAWCDQAGIALTDTDTNKLEQLSHDWQTGTLAPHRALRRQARGTSNYENLKTEELAKERAEQEALLHLLANIGAIQQDCRREGLPSGTSSLPITKAYLLRLGHTNPEQVTKYINQALSSA